MVARLSAALLLTAVAAFALVASEAVFFATKPSFLSRLPTSAGLAAAAFAALHAVALSVPIAVLFGAIDELLARSGAGRARRIAAALPAALLFACTLLLLADTFSYTLFEIGILHTKAGAQAIYLVGFVLLLARLAVGVPKPIAWLARRSSAPIAAAALGLAALCTLVWVAVAESPLEWSDSPVAREPIDVIVLSGDGIELRFTSLGGYARDTTPFLKRLANESLVSPRHFTNVASTGGSVAALLSGRDPLATGMINAEHSFRGRAAFEHLPGVLRAAGYRTFEASMRNYADGADLNLREGFESANRRNPDGATGTLSRLGRRQPSAALLLERVRDRIVERVLHMAFIRRMENLHNVSKGHSSPGWDDEDRIAALLAWIDAPSDAAYFANVHLMGSHGPLYRLRERHWSKGQRMDQPFMRDFYDDAIRDFDRTVEQVVDHLEKRGRLDRTVLIINSDHGVRWATRQPLPLVVRLPGGTPNGVIAAPTQRIDIAPTILDAVGIDVPDWMDGLSLLPSAERLPLGRPVFAVSHFTGPTPEGYGALGLLSLVECGRTAAAVLVTTDLEQTDPPEDALWCTPHLLASRETARAAFHARLRAYGYDTSVLGKLRAIRAE